MRTLSRLAIVTSGTAIAVTAALGVGVATDYWHATGTGSGYAKAKNAQSTLSTDTSSNTLTASGTSASLEPGGNGDLGVSVKSSKSYTTQYNTLVFSAPALSDTSPCTANGSDTTTVPLTLNSSATMSGGSGATAWTAVYSAAGGGQPAKITVSFTSPQTISSSAANSYKFAGFVTLSANADNNCQDAVMAVPVAASYV